MDPVVDIAYSVIATSLTQSYIDDLPEDRYVWNYETNDTELKFNPKQINEFVIFILRSGQKK